MLFSIDTCHCVTSRERMTLNSSANVVSVLKQKMIDNKSQVEKYKEEIGEKENYFQVCIQLKLEVLGLLTNV